VSELTTELEALDRAKTQLVRIACGIEEASCIATDNSMLDMASVPASLLNELTTPAKPTEPTNLNLKPDFEQVVIVDHQKQAKPQEVSL
jgi:hypothetical protein